MRDPHNDFRQAFDQFLQIEAFDQFLKIEAQRRDDTAERARLRAELEQAQAELEKVGADLVALLLAEIERGGK